MHLTMAAGDSRNALRGVVEAAELSNMRREPRFHELLAERYPLAHSF